VDRNELGRLLAAGQALPDQMELGVEEVPSMIRDEKDDKAKFLECIKAVKAEAKGVRSEVVDRILALKDSVGDGDGVGDSSSCKLYCWRTWRS